MPDMTEVLSQNFEDFDDDDGSEPIEGVETPEKETPPPPVVKVDFTNFDPRKVLSEAAVSDLTLKMKEEEEYLSQGITDPEDYGKHIETLADLRHRLDNQTPHRNLDDAALEDRALDTKADYEVWLAGHNALVEQYGEESAVVQRSLRDGKGTIDAYEGTAREVQRREDLKAREAHLLEVAKAALPDILAAELQEKLSGVEEKWQRDKIHAEYGVPIEQREDYAERLEAAVKEAEDKFTQGIRERYISETARLFPANVDVQVQAALEADPLEPSLGDGTPDNTGMPILAAAENRAGRPLFGPGTEGGTPWDDAPGGKERGL